MTPRLNPLQAAPEAYKAVLNLEKYVRGAFDRHLLHLLKLRASQINGCAYCVDMHVKEALDDGEDPQRLYLVSAWRESPLYSDKERAVLAWTESLTLLSRTGAPDADFEPLRRHFSEAEIVNLSVAIGMINLWNRWAVGFRSQHPVGMDTRMR
ncbi:MAG TPA: carboxymuconolactone decarboxylase family protein [Burkholderiales bacterium]|nr:carboxymuconolactone decarboxylase family protein [Burkholderiales bacterium]